MNNTQQAMDAAHAQALIAQLRALNAAVEMPDGRYFVRIGDAKPMTDSELAERIVRTTDSIVGLGFHPETGARLAP